jgi:hypothetical protein
VAVLPTKTGTELVALLVHQAKTGMLQTEYADVHQDQTGTETVVLPAAEEEYGVHPF